MKNSKNLNIFDHGEESEIILLIIFCQRWRASIMLLMCQILRPKHDLKGGYETLIAAENY